MESQQRTSKKAKNKARNKKLIKILLVELLVFVLLIVGYGVYYVNSKADLMVIDYIADEDIEINDIQSGNIDKYTTYALFGGDAREVGTFGKGTHSDCIIVASINNETNEVKLVSVYRDTYLEIANKDSDCLKANSAYFLGGGEMAINTLNRNLDLDIKDYVMVDWRALINAIDALGGVDVHVESNELSVLNSSIEEQNDVTGITSNGVYDTGMLHLNGSQATAYSRIRSTGQGDITRTERQREVIASMITQAKKSDLKTLNKLIDKIFPQVGTSINKKDMITLAAALFDYQLGDTSGFPYTYVPMSIGSKGDLLVPASLESNVSILHKFLFEEESYTPSSTVKRISDKMINASGVHDTTTGDELDNITNTQIDKQSE